MEARRIYCNGTSQPYISVMQVHGSLCWCIEAPIAIGDDVNRYEVRDGVVFCDDYPIIMMKTVLFSISVTPAAILEDKNIVNYLKELPPFDEEAHRDAMATLITRVEQEKMVKTRLRRVEKLLKRKLHDGEIKKYTAFANGVMEPYKFSGNALSRYLKANPDVRLPSRDKALHVMCRGRMRQYFDIVDYDTSFTDDWYYFEIKTSNRSKNVAAYERKKYFTNS